MRPREGDIERLQKRSISTIPTCELSIVEPTYPCFQL